MQADEGYGLPASREPGLAVTAAPNSHLFFCVYRASYFLESLWISLLALTLLLVSQYLFFTCSIFRSLAEGSVEVLGNLVNELEGVEP